ncbi:outer membrane protein assembly factor BamB [Breznakibacter xylanolyticus]|uniref:Outer membrane protein assembly factor BamB n=1 Tax=Breznakibacter xylanolyticus TaxID=990 RepID=A0A2W7MRC3_9BACT|nr:PQQ-binding-like beta-propeller repeat protein [Breznakibacter xylanolyticus]PZX10123.1 outer membrane protein assembly factor BamB [Breznakibacter xylanolyticus]
MIFTIKKEYKLKGERNISARKPLIYNNSLYVILCYDKKGFTESRLQCLDLETFELKWEYTHNHVLNNLEISLNDKLLCGCMDGEVKCFNPSDGEIVWTFKTEESNIGAISNIYNDKIIFSGVQARGKSTWCLDVNTGKLLWQIENKGHAYIPLIAENKGFFCIGNNIYSISLRDGSLNWEQNEPDTYIFNPKKNGDKIVVGGHGKVNIYDFDSGELILSIETGIRSSIREICFDSDNNLYFGDEEGNFYCYHFQFIKKLLGKGKFVAEKKWSYKAKGGIQGAAALMNESIYFITDGEELISLNIINGELNWDFNTKGKAGISGVSIVNDEIFIACGNGYVYRLKK